MKTAVDYMMGNIESEEEAIEGLQDLIDTGMAWTLEGSVGRAAMAAIESGQCVLGPESRNDYWGNRIPSRTEVVPGTKGTVEYANRLRAERGEDPLEVN